MSIFASQYAKKYGIDNKIVREAQKNIYDGEVRLIGFSGKICSGKDTIAKQYMNSLKTTEKETAFFAESLKDEITMLMDIIREEYNNTALIKRKLNKANQKNSIQRFVTEKNVTEEEAEKMYHLLEPDALESSASNGFTRTENIRIATQYWATDVWRKYDDMHWVKKTAQTVVELLAEGKNVFVTDVRFVNEAKSILDLGGIVVRLDVSVLEQQRRLLVRDGIGMKKKQIMHESEVALDEFRDFTIRIDTDGKHTNEIVKELQHRVVTTPIDDHLTRSGEKEADINLSNFGKTEPENEAENSKPETNPSEFAFKSERNERKKKEETKGLRENLGRGLTDPEKSSVDSIEHFSAHAESMSDLAKSHAQHVITEGEMESQKFPTKSPFPSKKKDPEVYRGPRMNFPTKSPFRERW